MPSRHVPASYALLGKPFEKRASFSDQLLQITRKHHLLDETADRAKRRIELDAVDHHRVAAAQFEAMLVTERPEGPTHLLVDETTRACDWTWASMSSERWNTNATGAPITVRFSKATVTSTLCRFETSRRTHSRRPLPASPTGSMSGPTRRPIRPWNNCTRLKRRPTGFPWFCRVFVCVMGRTPVPHGDVVGGVGHRCVDCLGGARRLS